jgi:hypothetical protein
MSLTLDFIQLLGGIFVGVGLQKISGVSTSGLANISFGIFLICLPLIVQILQVLRKKMVSS